MSEVESLTVYGPVVKDFEITFRVKNNLIKKRRESLGLTARQLAKQSGVGYALVLDYEALRKSPLKKVKVRSEIVRAWNDSARKLATFFGVEPEELWTDAVLEVRKPVLVSEVSAERLLDAASFQAVLEPVKTPEELLTNFEPSPFLEKALCRLTGREREVIKMRFDVGLTLEQAGEHYDLSRERIRGIEAKALRKLRHSFQFSDSNEIRAQFGLKLVKAPCMNCAAERAAALENGLPPPLHTHVGRDGECPHSRS